MTTNYKLSLTQSKNKITPRSIVRNKISETSGLSDFFGDEGDYRLVSESSCREVLVHRITSINAKIRTDLKKDMYYWVTMSAEGFGAHTFYSLMVRSKERVRVQNMLRSVFGIEMFITLHRFRKNIPAINVSGKTKYFPGYYSVHFDLSKLEDSVIHTATISAIYGVLREPRVIRKTLSGEIHDTATLIKELISISYDRMLMKDKTPPMLDDLWAIGHDDVTKGDIIRQWNLYALNSLNSTGSDWASLFCLANYIGLSSENTPDYSDSSNFYKITSGSGPISSTIGMPDDTNPSNVIVNALNEFEGSPHLTVLFTSNKHIAESSEFLMSLDGYV